jgi:hypothetical protein
MKVCEGCGAPLTKRHQFKFCSNKCQRAMERREHIREWLETGQARAAAGRGHYIKRYLLESQANSCAICGLKGEWEGLPLVLIVDHINGDSSDNGRENLRMICPNCDSQLPTFKARNRGNGRVWRRQRYANGQSY